MTYEEQVSRRRLSFTGLNKGFGNLKRDEPS